MDEFFFICIQHSNLKSRHWLGVKKNQVFSNRWRYHKMQMHTSSHENKVSTFVDDGSFKLECQLELQFCYFSRREN